MFIEMLCFVQNALEALEFTNTVDNLYNSLSVKPHVLNAVQKNYLCWTNRGVGTIFISRRKLPFHVTGGREKVMIMNRLYGCIILQRIPSNPHTCMYTVYFCQGKWERLMHENIIGFL